MPLIVSISGIRGVFGDGLDPLALVRYAGGFGTWCRHRAEARGMRPVVVLGRDARVTGELCARLVGATLQSTGCHVVDAGLATTPTVEMGLLSLGAIGGVMVSASHNPAEWNALKLFNERGEYVSAEEGMEILALADTGAEIVSYAEIGSFEQADFLAQHVESILGLPYIDRGRIGAADFRVVVDGVNSVGGIAVPALLAALGVRPDRITVLNEGPSGRFAHDPEPLPGNLADICRVVRAQGADIGLAVDPDVDRLALIADGGSFIGEELTQVVAADFVFRHRPGPFATNLSSSRLIEDIAARFGQRVYRAPVGEINVVNRMREVGAVLGGEGNGGVILPELHYGRDALVGTALVLQFLADTGRSLSELIQDYPRYAISKNKLPLDRIDADTVLARMAERYADERITLVDGVKIDFEQGWVHLRKSNTEPIIRVYSEAPSADEADGLARRFIEEMKRL